MLKELDELSPTMSKVPKHPAGGDTTAGVAVSAQTLMGDFTVFTNTPGDVLWDMK
jgi:hypothetical protein